MSREPRDAPDSETERESREPTRRTPALMFLPACALLAGAIGTGVWYGFADVVTTAAHRFVDVGAYAAAVSGKSVPGASISSASPEGFDYLYGFGATLLALTIATLDLWAAQSLRGWKRVRAAGAAMMAPVRALHTGRIGDYTAALVLGAGVLGGLMAITLR